MAGYAEREGGTFVTSYGNTSQGPSESSYGAKGALTSGISGAATGAAVGGQVGGWWGAAIGAVVGGITGSVFGFSSGKKKARAKRFQKLAQQVQQQRENNKDYNNFLQMIRQQRLARAASLSSAVATGTEMTSKTSGAVSGQQSQTAYSIQFLAEDRRLQSLFESYMRRAGKAASIAKDIDFGFNALQSVALAAGTMYSMTPETTPTTKPEPGTTVEGTLDMNPKFTF